MPARPTIGILAGRFLVNDTYAVQAAGEGNMRAVAEAADCLPLVIPGVPDTSDIGSLLDACDGFVLPGGRPNVHPEEYGEEETEAHGPFDRDRDAVALPLVREAVARGIPVFGVCRGFQEMAVAFGSALHPEIRELPGRMNHRMPPDGTLEEKFEKRHAVTLTPGGVFARLFGAEEVFVNTLHGQGVETPGPRVVIEGRAPDGTAEALRIEGAPGFALGVQWHAEWKAAEDPLHRVLYEAFGDAARAVKGKKLAA